MKIIYKNIALLMGLLMIVSAFSVSAAPVDTAVVDNEANVIVKGQLPGIEASTLVFAEVLTPKTNEADIENKSYDDLLPYIAWLGSTMTDDKGSYKLSFAFNPSLSGSYSVRIKWASSDGAPYLWQNKIIYISPNKNNEILADVNNSANSAALKTVIDDNLEFFAVKKDDYALFSDASKAQISSKIYASVPFADIDGFMRSFSAFTLSHLLSGCNSAGEALAYLDEYSADTAIAELNEYYLFDTKLSSGGKNYVADEMIKSAPYNSVSSLYTKFSDSVILSAFNSCRNTGEISSILNLTKDYMGISLSQYTSLSNKSTVNSKLAGKNFKSISEVVSTFEKAVQDAQNEINRGPEPAKPPSDVGGSYTYSSPSVGANSGSNKGEQEAGNTENSDDKDNKEETAVNFTDVPGSFWGYEAIKYLYEASIVNGDDGNMFYPQRLVTREEFCKMLVMASGAELKSGQSFDDVLTDAWYAPYVFTAYENGFVSGVGSNMFGTGKYITRQDMALMIYNVFAKDEVSSKGLTFDDNDIADYAANAIAILSERGVLNGKGNNLFFPNDNATRAEAAKIIYEIMKGEADG